MPSMLLLESFISSPACALGIHQYIDLHQMFVDYSDQCLLRCLVVRPKSHSSESTHSSGIEDTLRRPS